MISRRRLLHLGGLLAAAMLFGRRPLARPAERDALAKTLAGVVRRRADARILGRAYLSGRPDEADPATLARLICGPAGEQVRRLDASDLRLAVSERVRRDFHEGRTVVLHGWILSVTEARLYALTALAG